MNIQDIADFIDLVKNPAKYEKVLLNIKEEQERLNAVIETVGKAGELDKLRKQVEAEKEVLLADFERSKSEQDKRVEQEVAILSKKKMEYTDAVTKATELSSTAQAKLQEAEKLVASQAAREKALKQGEDGLRVRQEQLDALISEYNEKVSKLRSVMS